MAIDSKGGNRMHRWLILWLLLCSGIVQALTPEQLEAAKEAARKRAAESSAIDIDAPPASNGGVAGGTGPAAGGGCLPAGRDGRISLLGVQSDMGPGESSPMQRLAPDNPAMQPVLAFGWQLGLTAPPSGASPEIQAAYAAAGERKSLADYYEAVLGLANIGRGPSERLLNVQDPWPALQRAAQAHAEYQSLTRQYAALVEVAEEAGNRCPR